MTKAPPELWRRASVLFEAALDRPEPERAEFVRGVCGQDGELHDAVRTLLAFDEEPAAPAAPAQPADASLAPEPGPESPSGRLGPYRILRPIGQGGMSRIYLGERAGGDVEQRVAIKLIGETGHPAMQDLFRRERRILARLDHPYIARFLDGGTTEEGRPYVVMEYVEGFALTDYCDTLRLGVRRRLELFLEVCAAVEYAHRHLVVHRDLKPANILVTDAGQPKLLDFGIAELLDLPPASDSSQATSKERFLTPDYASPEQLRGEPVTTASDIYSLGVVLFQLLTGCLPRRLRTNSAAEAVAVAESAGNGNLPEIRAASRGTTPARLRRQLAGDLDHIVACCLMSDARERYSSVERLAEDLRRHLEGLPVKARPQRLLYRVGKFVRRHAVAVAAVGVAFLALAGFVAGTISHSRNVARQRDVARRAQQETEQVTRYLTDAFRFADVYQRADLGRAPGAQATMRGFLDYWAGQVERELRDQPLLQARLLHTLGWVYLNLGSTDEALPLFRQALAARRRTLGNERLEVAESLNGLGAALLRAGRIDEPEPLLREALAISRKASANGHELADSLMFLGLLLIEKNEYAAAEPLLREALSTYQRLDGAVSRPAAKAWMNLGTALWLRRDLGAAESALRKALEILHRVAGEEHPDVAEALTYLGHVLIGRGEYRGAELVYRKALAMRRRLLGPEHPETLVSQAALAEFLAYKGDYAAAAPLQEKVLAIERRIKGEMHPDVVKDLHSLALVRWHLGDLAVAESLLREAWEKARRLWGAENRATLAYQQHLGELLGEKGDTEAAEGLLRHALELQSKLLGPDDRSVGVTSSALADVLTEQGRFEEALVLAEKAVRVIRAVDPEGHWRPAVAESVRGACLAGIGRFEEAEELLVRSLAVIEAGRGAGSRHTRAALRRLIRFYEARGRRDEARKYRARLERQSADGGRAASEDS